LSIQSVCFEEFTDAVVQVYGVSIFHLTLSNHRCSWCLSCKVLCRGCVVSRSNTLAKILHKIKVKKKFNWSLTKLKSRKTSCMVFMYLQLQQIIWRSSIPWNTFGIKL